jgi:hypothetical protein
LPAASQVSGFVQASSRPLSASRTQGVNSGSKLSRHVPAPSHVSTWLQSFSVKLSQGVSTAV